MMLDIIMPHYTEDWSIVKPYFDMLSCQKCADMSQIRVRIVHDGVKAFPKSYFSKMPFQVLQDCLPHGGVSAARNYGIEKADAKWITFCDCDDMFNSPYAMKFIFEVLGTEDYDMLWNEFVMENKETDGSMNLQVNRKFNMVWTHNKYYRLDFIREHGLRFNESLYMSEDSAFNAIVNLEIAHERIGHIKSPMPLYIWTFREGSVTLDKSRLLLNMEGHFDRNVYVYNEFVRRNYKDANLMAGRTLTDAYVNLTRKELPEGWEHFRQRVREWAIENRTVLRSLTNDEMQRVLKASKTESEAARFLNPDRPGLVEWYKALVK